MNEFSNVDKQKHGSEANLAVEKMLEICKTNTYLRNIIKDFKCGYPTYKDDKQFKCHFLITFHDGTNWIVYVTTSLRERIKQQLWDTLHIKKFNPYVTKSYLIYPDSIPDEEKAKFITFKYQIHNRIKYSVIDDVFSQQEFYEFIENYANKQLSVGKRKDKEGNNFERRISNILSYAENLKKYKTNDPRITGLNYPFFKKIIDSFNIDIKKVIGIKAICDSDIIGHLMTGGKPKTDIIVTVYFSDDYKLSHSFTISCKKTKLTKVSVHQYTADAFADVLDPENEKLRVLLRAFQNAGNLKTFGLQNKEELTKELKPYLQKLIKWVLGGYGGKIRDELQLANYILVNDSSEIYIHTLDEYINLLVSSNTKGNFGTPFQWTYASKRKGKDIQLKCKIIK